jgi:hypothetical protein
VNAIVNTAGHPSEEVPVGWRAQGAYISHRIAPDIPETISSNIAQPEQVEKGAPAAVTTGDLFHPVQAGRSVEGGKREQMKRERSTKAPGQAGRRFRIALMRVRSFRLA